MCSIGARERERERGLGFLLWMSRFEIIRVCVVMGDMFDGDVEWMEDLTVFLYVKLMGLGELFRESCVCLNK